MRETLVQYWQKQSDEETKMKDGDNHQKNDDLRTLAVVQTTPSVPLPVATMHEKMLILLILLWVILLIIVAFVGSLSTSIQSFIVGLGANLNLLFFYGAPLSTIFTVLWTRNASSIHVWTMCINTINGTFWTAYGLAIWNPFLYVLNGAGVVLGLVQFALCVMFPRREVTEVASVPGEADGLVGNETTRTSNRELA